MPDQEQRIKDLEKAVKEIMSVTDVNFIENLKRRLDI